LKTKLQAKDIRDNPLLIEAQRQKTKINKLIKT